MSAAADKYERLREILTPLGRVAVAFSGGVDSAFLLKTAADVLGPGAAAVTLRHAAFPKRELEEARSFCGDLGIKLIEAGLDVFSVEGFASNPPDRCYLCKRSLFAGLIAAAAENGFSIVAEGSNRDDEGDYRPGMRAVAELGVISPLREAGLTKAEIRELSKALDLPTWDKPSYACLATRVPYGERITHEKLRMIEEAENALSDLGFRQARVRHHGSVARVEIGEEDYSRFLSPELRAAVDDALRGVGFSFVSLDLSPYRSGRMNAGLGESRTE